jgi:hypothetical protein
VTEFDEATEAAAAKAAKANPKGTPRNTAGERARKVADGKKVVVTPKPATVKAKAKK